MSKKFRSNAIYPMIAYVIVVLQRGFHVQVTSERLADICRALKFEKVMSYDRGGSHRTFGDAEGFNIYGLKMQCTTDKEGIKIITTNLHDFMLVMHNILSYVLERIDTLGKNK